MKQFAKACAKDAAGRRAVLAQPWHSGGKIYATDSVRAYRLTLDERFVDPEWPDFAISVEACRLGKPKKAFQPFPDHVHTEWGRFESVQPEGVFPKADKLFALDRRPTDHATLDPQFVVDAAELAKSVGRRTDLRVAFSHDNGPVSFEFPTPWGWCECLVMTKRE